MRRVLVVLAMSLLWIRGATATDGGPQLAEVLGWDAGAKRVYVRVLHEDARGDSPTVFYFDLLSTQPAQARQLQMLKGESYEEVWAAEERRTASLRRRLRTLRMTPVTSFVRGGIPSVHDTVSTPDGPRRRYVMSTQPGHSCYDSTLRIITLDPSPNAVRRLARYELPGTKAELLILSCEGEPHEGGYEIQFPVVLGAGPGTADPIDPMDFNGNH